MDVARLLCTVSWRTSSDGWISRSSIAIGSMLYLAPKSFINQSLWEKAIKPGKDSRFEILTLFMKGHMTPFELNKKETSNLPSMEFHKPCPTYIAGASRTGDISSIQKTSLWGCQSTYFYWDWFRCKVRGHYCAVIWCLCAISWLKTAIRVISAELKNAS